MLLVGVGLTPALLYDAPERLKQLKSKQILQDRIALRDARRALMQYMLLRSQQPFNIARIGGSPIEPRLLMLPCPDNLGDSILDGLQDATCNAVRSSGGITNGVLEGGSRFGRLPHGFSVLQNAEEVNDGLGSDFRNHNGDRFWYALSRHLAPSTPGNRYALNLHRLSTLDDGWLKVARTATTLTIASRTAAIVIAPGEIQPHRPAEENIFKVSLSLSEVNPLLYFESVDNADSDGIFSDKEGGYPVANIRLEELLAPESNFMDSYKTAAGAGATHNAPLQDSPLAEIREAILHWKDFFGYYPSPAANVSAHLHRHSRHCNILRSDVAHNNAIGGGELILPAAIIAAMPLPTTLAIASLSLTADAGFLTAQAMAVVLSTATITLARYSRFTLTAGTPLFVNTAILQSLTSGYGISAGATVSIAVATISIAVETPLFSDGIQVGWFPEHSRTTMIVSHDNKTISLAIPTEAGFLGGGKIISTIGTIETVTLSSRDILILSKSVKIEKDYGHLLSLFYADATVRTKFGTSVSLYTLREANKYLPSSDTYDRRDFVVRLLSDAVYGSSTKTTIIAPKIIYPWQDTNSGPIIRRDSLHPYPPCLDSRSFSRSARTFIANQPMHYAVAPGCGHSDPQRCGSGGITVSLNPGAQISFAESFSLSNSYTVTLPNFAIRLTGNATITIQNGIARNNGNISLTRPLQIPLGESAAIFPANYSFDNGTSVQIPAQATIVGGGRSRIENAEAVLIYSPGPLPHAGCAAGMPSLGLTLAVATQGKIGGDLTNFCEWLDDDENADGDLHYIARAPSLELRQSNDFLMFFGGRMVLE